MHILHKWSKWVLTKERWKSVTLWVQLPPESREKVRFHTKFFQTRVCKVCGRVQREEIIDL